MMDVFTVNMVSGVALVVPAETYRITVSDVPIRVLQILKSVPGSCLVTWWRHNVHTVFSNSPRKTRTKCGSLAKCLPPVFYEYSFIGNQPRSLGCRLWPLSHQHSTAVQVQQRLHGQILARWPIPEKLRQFLLWSIPCTRLEIMKTFGMSQRSWLSS